MTDKANGPMIERRINNLRAIADDETVNNFARSICSEASNYLAAIRSQPVPVEPVATVYDAYDTTGIDWHCKHPPAVGAKIYDQSAIDSLQSALQRAQEERDRHMGAVKAYIEDADAMKQRAEKAEAILIQHYCDYEFKPTLEQAAEMMLEERNEKKALEAENAALREDAERYRWLRDQHEGKLPIEMDADGFPMPQEVAALAFTVFYPDPTGDESLVVVPTGNLDETIDAAIDSAGAE